MQKLSWIQLATFNFKCVAAIMYILTLKRQHIDVFSASVGMTVELELSVSLCRNNVDFVNDCFYRQNLYINIKNSTI